MAAVASGLSACDGGGFGAGSGLVGKVEAGEGEENGGKGEGGREREAGKASEVKM
jgi:hypothetical protein